ncbi:hypothetical protein HWV62_9871 [Athelia sp. TMB]|nr:hypothetical protein HWV62_9871 [Athelia sp. TMB]
MTDTTLRRQWTSKPNKIIPDEALPINTTRHLIPIPSGSIKILAIEPSVSQQQRDHYLFFQHGAFGHASMWLPSASFLSQEHNYSCYAISIRGHGASWVPEYFQMWIMSLRTAGGDSVAGIEWAKVEARKRSGEAEGGMVLVGHSIGGAIMRSILLRHLVKVDGLVLLTPISGSGIYALFLN